MNIQITLVKVWCAVPVSFSAALDQNGRPFDFTFAETLNLVARVREKEKRREEGEELRREKGGNMNGAKAVS